MIGRREGFHVERHGGVLEAGVVVFEGFELTKVGGGNREPGPLRQLLEQGNRQSRALGGIGARTHLIKQHQRGTGRAGQIRTGWWQRLKDAGNAAHMAAEGGEVLLQRLLIADVGQHLCAPGQTRTTAAGHKQAGPGHQGR